MFEIFVFAFCLFRAKNLCLIKMQYKHSYKTKHNGLQRYTYLNKHRGRKDFLCNSDVSNNIYEYGQKTSEERIHCSQTSTERTNGVNRNWIEILKCSTVIDI